MCRNTIMPLAFLMFLSIADLPFITNASAEEKPATPTEREVMLALSTPIENSSKGALSIFKADIESMHTDGENIVTVIAKVEAGFNMSQKDIENLIEQTNHSSIFRVFLGAAIIDHRPVYKGKIIKTDRLKATLHLEDGHWLARKVVSVSP